MLSAHQQRVTFLFLLQYFSTKGLSDPRKIIHYASEDPDCMAQPACPQFNRNNQSDENSSNKC
jgi:hypothetical protein